MQFMNHPKKTRYGATSSDWKMHFCALPDVIFNSQVGGPNYFSKFQPWYNFMCKFIMNTSVEGDDASFIISIFELHNLNWALNSQFFWNWFNGNPDQIAKPNRFGSTGSG